VNKIPRWIVRPIAHRAGITQRVESHTLRYAFITARWTPGCAA